MFILTEMGGLHEERFVGSGRGEREQGMGGMEMVGGDGSETGSVMKNEN